MSNKIGIITSLVNSKDFIDGFLCDIKKQSIFNDCYFVFLAFNESDYVLDKISLFCKKNKNCFLKEYDQIVGIYSAWNYGVDYFDEYDDVVYLSNWNVDDRRSPYHLEYHQMYLDNNLGIDIVYAPNLISFVKNQTFEELPLDAQEFPCLEHSWNNLLRNNSPHCAPVWRKNLHERFGKFKETYFSAGDGEMWLRACSMGANAAKIPDVLGVYYENPNGISTGDKKAKAIQEVLCMREQYYNLVPQKIPSNREDVIVYCTEDLGSNSNGGAEINDREYIKYLESKYTLIKIKSSELHPTLISSLNCNNYIFSNFWGIAQESIERLKEKNNIIIEHDYKFEKTKMLTRILEGKSLKLSDDEILFRDFYKNAKVLCQSNYQKNIFIDNLGEDGFKSIQSLSGNLWSEEDLSKIDEILDIRQDFDLDTWAIMDGSTTLHKAIKGVEKAQQFCEDKGMKYKIIEPQGYHDFLQELSFYKGLIFFPQVPETFSRVVMEALMMKMEVISNDNFGAKNEECYQLVGKELIEYFRGKRKEIFNKLESLFV